MTKPTLWGLWAALFVLCAAMGFLPEPTGALRILSTGLSILFFLPAFWLLRRCTLEKDRFGISLLRNLSVLSLGLTVLLIIGNFASIRASETIGRVLYSMLVIVSTPMIASGYWVLSLFLWACLMVGSLSALRSAAKG